MCLNTPTAATSAPSIPAPPADDPNDMTDKYNTVLSPAQEADYQKQHERRDSYDYDMRGAYKAGITAEGNGHFPDTYKKPNHPTFSDQSQYSGKDGNQGGSWNDAGNGKFTFKTGPTNERTHSRAELEDYFAKVEEGNRLEWSNPDTPASPARKLTVPTR